MFSICVYLIIINIHIYLCFLRIGNNFIFPTTPESSNTKSPLISPLASKSRRQSPNDRQLSETTTLTFIVNDHPVASLIHALAN